MASRFVSYVTSRWKYLKLCGKYAKEHWVIAMLLIVFAVYEIIASLLPLVQVPTIQFSLPKLPLPWALSIFLIGLLFMVIEGGCRLKDADEKRHQEALQSLRDESKATDAADPFLALMERRQILEDELEPLEKIEERRKGFKVVPALRVAGKDENDFRGEKIERLKRDIADVGRRIETQKVAKVLPHGWSELNREKSALEDDVAQKEAELEHNKLMAPLSIAPFLWMQPDKNALLRGEIERRKKRIKQIDDQLGF